MGFGKVLKCKSCDSEQEIYLGESETKEIETVLFCKICGVFGNKSDLEAGEKTCCGKPLEELKEFGELDKKIKKFSYIESVVSAWHDEGVNDLDSMVEYLEKRNGYQNILTLLRIYKPL